MIYVKQSIVKLHLFTSMQILSTDKEISTYPRIHLISLSLNVYNLE